MPHEIGPPMEDTPRLLVLEVVAESPAEKQGVRPGSRLAKINGMSVETWQEVWESCEPQSNPSDLVLYKIDHFWWDLAERSRKTKNEASWWDFCMCILLECMKCGQNEAPNEAQIHEKVSFVDPAPNAPCCKKFLWQIAVLVGF